MATVRAEAPTPEPATAPQPERRRRLSWGGFSLRPATAFAAVAVLAVGVIGGYALSGGDEGDGRVVVDAEATGEVPVGAVSAQLEHGAGGDAILHVDRIPALDSNHVYEAWAARGGAMEPLASFRPDRSGADQVVLSDSLQGADAVLVTQEPKPAGQSPSTAPILRAPLG